MRQGWGFEFPCDEAGKGAVWSRTGEHNLDADLLQEATPPHIEREFSMSLHEIQSKVHVSKDKKNEFGGYNYRTAEGILAAAKAALPDGWSIVCSDRIQEIATQIFVSATAFIKDGNGTIVAEASGHAMHPLQKKGMDPSQITGAASSYARKYALSGLLALDDGSVDPDATNNREDAAGSLSPNVQAWEDGIMDTLPDDPSAETLADAYADQLEADMATYKSLKWLDAYKQKHDTHIRFVEEHAPERYGPLKALYLARRKELGEGKAA